MIDIFLQKDVSKLLKDKKVVFLGDSNIRALYKDVICLLSQSKLISQKMLKTKGENSCFGDKLQRMGPRYNGREYREERKLLCGTTRVSFYFLTQVYNSYVKEILDHLSKDKHLPDILIVNSCLWDVTRWGPNGVDTYKKNLSYLMQDLKKLMPDCLVIWVTAPPIARDLRGGFLVQEIQFLKYSLRFHVMEANYYARKVVVDHGFDVVDCHYHLKLQLHRRCDDGVHWQPSAVRYVTNLLLTHISLALNVTLPHRFESNVNPENVNNTSEKENEEKKRKLVSSEVTKPVASENHTNIKKEKEEVQFISPKKSKKRRKSRGKNKYSSGQSHHAYFKRMDYEERQKRIRRWQIPSEMQVWSSNRPSEVWNYNEPYSPYKSHQDSGYFSSPNNPRSSWMPQTYETYESRRVLLPKRSYRSSSYRDDFSYSTVYQPYTCHDQQPYDFSRDIIL